MLDLGFEALGVHDGVEEDAVGAEEGGEDVEAFHEVGHADVVVAVGALLAGLEEGFVEEVVGVGGVEGDGVGARRRCGGSGGIGAGVDPDGVGSGFVAGAEDGGE